MSPPKLPERVNSPSAPKNTAAKRDDSREPRRPGWRREDSEGRGKGRDSGKQDRHGSKSLSLSQPQVKKSCSIKVKGRNRDEVATKSVDSAPVEKSTQGNTASDNKSGSLRKQRPEETSKTVKKVFKITKRAGTKGLGLNRETIIQKRTAISLKDERKRKEARDMNATAETKTKNTNLNDKGKHKRKREIDSKFHKDSSRSVSQAVAGAVQKKKKVTHRRVIAFGKQSDATEASTGTQQSQKSRKVVKNGNKTLRITLKK